MQIEKSSQNMLLHNRINKEILKQRLQSESFRRKTLSFYRYVILNDPQSFRDHLYKEWNKLNCFGRIYIAKEGINAQMSVPEHHVNQFLNCLYNHEELNGVPLKWAVEDDGKSFYKLTIKVRPKIVADGLDDHSFDVTNVGNHLSPLEFHNMLDNPSTIVIDMRNHYESEIGHFENAYCPDADTFKDEIQIVTREFEDKKDQKVLLYCTGGIRCEKASAYLKHQGFMDVNQLHGGIIAYAQEIKKLGLNSKFIGKNFVFDDRLGENINGEIISKCHQCGKPSNTHTNCANDDCHLLFIQCEECRNEYHGCCTNECKDIIALPKEQQIGLRAILRTKYSSTQIFRSRLRPKLRVIDTEQARK